MTLTFPTAQYINLENIAGVAILPQVGLGSVSNPATFTDANPVGTGPYMLGSFTPQGFTLVKNPNYWQRVPVKVPKVYFPVYTSNTGALSALFSGQIDWTGNYIPGLQKDFVDTNPANHHYWEAAGSSNALWPNLNTWPTNQLAVRKAIDLAINRPVIGSEGESGLESPLTNASGITLPTLPGLGGPGRRHDRPRHRQTRPRPSGRWRGRLQEGQRRLLRAERQGSRSSRSSTRPPTPTTRRTTPSIAQQLRAAGINVTFEGLTVNAWNADVADGDFQLTMHWGNGGITPYNMYDNWLDDTLVSRTGATGDYERLKDPAMQADLADLSGDLDGGRSDHRLAPIEEYVANNLPVIPTTTAADWFEYNSQNYTGWPTQANPYDSGQPSGTNNGPGTGSDEVVVLHLTPAS